MFKHCLRRPGTSYLRLIRKGRANLPRGNWEPATRDTEQEQGVAEPCYAAGMMVNRVPLTAAVVALTTAACCPSSLQPDIQRPGARVSTSGQPAVAGVFHAADWPALGMPAPKPGAVGECRHDREELESWLGKRAESCDRVRGQAISVTGSGDADQPVPAPIAPSCYCLGKAIVVVEYEMIQTACTRVVGLGIIARD